MCKRHFWSSASSTIPPLHWRISATIPPPVRELASIVLPIYPASSHSFGWDFIWKCIRAQSVCCRFNICFQDFSFRMIYACVYLVSPNLGVTDVMTRPDLYLLMRSYRCPHLGTRICCICLYLLSHNRHLYLGPFLYCADISRIHYVIQNQNCRLKIILASDLQDHHLYPFKRSDVSNWSILAVKCLLFGQKGPDWSLIGTCQHTHALCFLFMECHKYVCVRGIQMAGKHFDEITKWKSCHSANLTVSRKASKSIHGPILSWWWAQQKYLDLMPGMIFWIQCQEGTK